MSISDDINRLHQLLQAGAINESEFTQLKARLMAESAQHNGNKVNSFRRSRNDRWIGGVCGGLGRVSDLESWIWRLAFVLFTCYFGVGILIYILACIFIPDDATP
ncbi:MAG: hypothetical protein RL748_3573 [Pseudomonadota bacterium]|jgi:phage shock protein PspC (stress-responsive transcriptional regulator)